MKKCKKCWSILLIIFFVASCGPDLVPKESEGDIRGLEGEQEISVQQMNFDLDGRYETSLKKVYQGQHFETLSYHEDIEYIGGVKFLCKVEISKDSIVVGFINNRIEILENIRFKKNNEACSAHNSSRSSSTRVRYLGNKLLNYQDMGVDTSGLVMKVFVGKDAGIIKYVYTMQGDEFGQKFKEQGLFNPHKSFLYAMEQHIKARLIDGKVFNYKILKRQLKNVDLSKINLQGIPIIND